MQLSTVTVNSKSSSTEHVKIAFTEIIKIVFKKVSFINLSEMQMQKHVIKLN